MADSVSALKGTAKKKSRSFLQSANASNTSIATANSGRLSVINGRLQRVTSQSLEKLSFISEKDDSSDLESYHIEYGTYLLRKAQNRMLTKNKEEKEENVKECFVSLKCELEDLLGKFLKLSEEIGYIKAFVKTQMESNKKIEDGKRVLNMLKENKFEDLLKLLSSSLDLTVDQLQLIGIDKELINEMFSEKIWGLGSEIGDCLKKINASVSRNKSEVSKIATELTEIKVLSLENKMLRKRFDTVFEEISNEILETRYKLFTETVKKGFNQREENKNEFLMLKLDFNADDFLLSGMKPQIHQNTLNSFQLSKFEGSYPMMPCLLSSTPHQI